MQDCGAQYWKHQTWYKTYNAHAHFPARANEVDILHFYKHVQTLKMSFLMKHMWD